MKKLTWFGSSLLIIFLDQLTKYWALSSLYFYQPKPILAFLNFTLAHNTGAAFSFLSQSGDWHIWFFTGLSLIMVIVFAIWLFRLGKEANLQAFAISLILGGAAGNLIDRLRLGFVVDFIDFHVKTYHFAVFNLADASICIGAFLLIFTWWYTDKTSN